MEAPLKLRIFVSSPGDVGQERQIAKRVIERLDAEFGDAAALDPYFWEYEPFVITGDYQEQIPPPSTFDIFICILWSRLGSRLSAKYTLPPDHEKVADSGTEYEFVDAKLAYEERKSPEIMVWVNKTKVTVDVDDPGFEDIKGQRDALNQFIEGWTRDDKTKTFTGAINRYATREEFEEKLEVKLKKLILKRIGDTESGIRSRPLWSGNPYRGLSVFEYRHAPVFCGRTTAISQAVDQLDQRLRQVWQEREKAAQVAEETATVNPDSEDAVAYEQNARAFLLIFGASGSGKSSLARAGVLPMLAESGAVEGVGQWRCAVMKPTDGGGNLMLSLSNALIAGAETLESLAEDERSLLQDSPSLQPAALPELTSDDDTAATLASLFVKNPHSAADRVVGAIAQVSALLAESDRQHLRTAISRDQKAGRAEDVAALEERLAGYQPKRVCLVLVLDQLEELFTRDYSSKQLEAFLLAIDGLASCGRVAVIATLRSDFFGECEGREAFHRILMRLKAGKGTLHLLPPRNHELSQMIRLPAQAAGVRFEETSELGKLEDRIRDAALRDEDSLPLLQFCLEKLYEAGADDGLLEHNEYGIDEDRPGIGQLKGVLSRHAEETFEKLKPHQQEVLSSVILSMASVGDSKNRNSGPQLIRRVVSYDSLIQNGEKNEEEEITPEKALVDAFIDARLFTSNLNAESTRTVSVTHEALLRRWDRVSVWLGLDENQRFLKTRKQVAQKLKLWQENGNDDSFLLQPGRELDDAADQFGEHSQAFEKDEVDFIQRSLAKARADESQRIRKRNVTIFSLSVLSILALCAAGWAFAKEKKANQEKLRAEAQEEKSNQQVLEAARKAWGASRQAFDERDDRRTGFARLAEAVRYNQSLPEEMRLGAINTDAYLRTNWGSVLDLLTLGNPMQHTSRVNSARFSPDGKRVVTASSNAAQIWDAETGAPLVEPIRHESYVKSAAFSPDGKRLVTTSATLPDASSNETVRIWDAETCTPLGESMRHEGEINNAEFSPDGKCVVSASDDNTARIWNAETGAALGEPLEHEAYVRGAKFSPDGKWVVTASWDKTAKIWDAKTGAPLTKPMRHEDVVNSAEFSPDGKWVVTTSGMSLVSSEHMARIWDAKTGAPSGELMRHEDIVNSAEFSPDGKWVVTASDDNTARIWDAETGAPLGEPLQHKAYVRGAKFSPDGKWVVTVSDDNTARIWDAVTGAPLGDMRHESSVTSAEFSPDGNRVITSSGALLITSGDNVARIWVTETAAPLSEPMYHKNYVRSAEFSPDGKRVVTASSDTTRIWDAKSGAPLGELMRHEDIVNSAEFSPDGKWVVTASDDNTARIWDAETGTPLGEPLQHEAYVRGAKFSPDGKWMVTASWDKTARIWDAKTGAPLTELMRHEDVVNSAEFSPDGKWVVTAGGDKTARIWDAETGAPLGEPLQHEAYVRGAKFSPDGKWVVTASWDKTARIWDAKTGASVTEPMRHEDVVNSAEFSPDGKWVVTAGDDNIARIWDAKTGAPLGEPIRHESEVNNAKFSADGKWVVTASDDRTARIWDTETCMPLGEPLRHDGPVNNVQFSPDGKWLVTVSGSLYNELYGKINELLITSNTARIWDTENDVIAYADPRPLEVFGSYRVNSSGIVVKILFNERQKLRESLLSNLNDTSWGKLTRWRFSNSPAKTVSPNSSVTISKVVEREMDWVASHPKDVTNSQIIDSIYDSAPGHPLMPFALALVESDEDRQKFFVQLGDSRIAQKPASGETPTGLRVRSAAYEKIGEIEKAAALRKKLEELLK